MSTTVTIKMKDYYAQTYFEIIRITISYTIRNYCMGVMTTGGFQ